MMLLDRPVARFLPGLVLLALVASVASLVADLLPFGNSLLLAIALGVVATNVIDVPSIVVPGLQLHKLFLEAGIILLGVRFVLADLLKAGPIIVLLALGTVTFGIVFVELSARQLFQIPGKTPSLLAAGSSVCGVSAIIAIAGCIEPDEEEIAYAVATILLFDALTLVLFPLLEELLTLSAKDYGVWMD